MTADMPPIGECISIVERRGVPRRRGLGDRVRFGSGVDFGSNGFSLIERHDRDGQILSILAWFEGGWQPACGVRGFGRRYVPAQLKILWNSGFDSIVLQAGGRLSHSCIVRHAAVIDEHFGRSVADKTSLRHTLLLVED